MLKKIVSLVLFFSLFLAMLTALVVFIAPADRVASWSNWTFLGLSLAHWQGAHLGMGLLLLVAGLVHLACNWDGLLDHLRDDDGAVVIFTRPFFAGAILTLAVFVWALADLPPVRQFVAVSQYLKERAVDTYGEPPYALAERSTLEDLARRMGMDGDKALALLRLKNIKAENASLTLAEIARQNGVAPGGVFEALKMVQEPSGGSPAGLPKEPPPGLGRRKLSDICEEYGLDQPAVMGRLQAAGFKAQPAWTLTEVAKATNVLPIAVYEALRGDKPMTPVVVEPAPAAVTVEPAAPQAPAATPPTPQPQPAAPQAPTHATPAQPAPLAQPPLATTPAQPTAQPGYTPPSPGYAPAQPGYAPAQPAVGQPTPAAPQVQLPHGANLPTTPPPGLEKMMLQTFCREYDIPLSAAVQRLARHHITAFGDMTFTELALENNRSPADIMHLIVGQ
ncbi:DUF4405 domain-containing protein [Solidesulfovibrio sp.]|uniref:DUF4405 domain-containing protein n=1 Tax=Solidesulfovibrio sp. TaxID=2910990 RepID=UPI002B221598|nr:DUF4405 domain-containing protein [Solidesulfovibrio sp.]MEA4855180.1 DUF4405 domain-containing protein [Solidesulfovibrio sp.]